MKYKAEVIIRDSRKKAKTEDFLPNLESIKATVLEMKGNIEEFTKTVNDD